MKDNADKLKKLSLAANVKAVVKKLGRIRSQVSLLDMKDHARSIDKNIADLVKLKRELEKNE